MNEMLALYVFYNIKSVEEFVVFILMFIGVTLGFIFVMEFLFGKKK